MPSNYAQKYHKAILKARRTIIQDGIPKDAVHLLMRSYAQLISDLNKDLAAGELTEERYDALVAQIRERFDLLAQQLDKLFEKSKRTAINTMIQAHTVAISTVEQAAGVSVAVSFNAVPEQALELMMLRRGLNAKNYKAVINRDLQDAVEDIEDYLQSAITRGIGSRRATQELAGILASGNENVLQLVEDDKLTRSSTNKALREGDIDKDEYEAARKVIYDSRRIIVTETNTALRESNILCQQKSDVVKATRWETSSRHFALPSSPDVCDILASLDQFGLGDGVYPSGNVPSSPHPFCACHCSSVLISDPSKWGPDAGVPTQRPPTVGDSDIRDIMPDATDNAINRAVDEVNYYQNLAWKISTGAGADAA